MRMKQSEGWELFLMITLLTSKFLAMRNNTLYSVSLIQLNSTLKRYVAAPHFTQVRILYVAYYLCMCLNTK